MSTSRARKIAPVTEQSFSQADQRGQRLRPAREDHSHGTPTDPVSSVLGSILGTVAEVVVSENADGTITLGLANSVYLGGATATRLLATDGDKRTVSVANLASWIAGTTNRVTVSDDGDGTITLSAPQDLHTGATPTFAGATLASGDLTFSGTGRIGWTKITANGVSLTDATSADAVADLRTGNDGNTYTVDEAAGAAGQNLVVDFTGVTAFNWLRVLGRYKGSSAHEVAIQIEVSPFDGSTWHEFDGMQDQPADYAFENHSVFIPDSSAYINSGVVKVRFIHASGTPGHVWIFEEVALYQ